MKVFWKWMEEKGYGEYDGLTGISFIVDARGECPAGLARSAVNYTKQMLVGYMMEYCFEHGIAFNINDTDVYKILQRAIEKADK